ncbi:MAG TPA: hypothetical protein VG166_04950 [Caulobacteraceae bacterium]|jgi:hypothetical protein|nr:hypothetical protein [Caulobacteraceae bacterium]
MSKRDPIVPHKGDKRYVLGENHEPFGKEIDVGKSLAADRRHKARRDAVPDQGDRGDHHRK